MVSTTRREPQREKNEIRGLAISFLPTPLIQAKAIRKAQRISFAASERGTQSVRAAIVTPDASSQSNRVVVFSFPELFQ